MDPDKSRTKAVLIKRDNNLNPIPKHTIYSLKHDGGTTISTWDASRNSIVERSILCVAVWLGAVQLLPMHVSTCVGSGAETGAEA